MLHLCSFGCLFQIVHPADRMNHPPTIETQDGMNPNALGANNVAARKHKQQKK